MKTEDVKVGMKVVAHSKTVKGWGNLDNSREWKLAKNIGRNYLFVNSYSTDEHAWVLYNNASGGVGGDYFYAHDFEPYELEHFKKLEKLLMVGLSVDFHLIGDKSTYYCYASSADHGSEFTYGFGKSCEEAFNSLYDGVWIQHILEQGA